MRKKFGSYTINVVKKEKKINPDGLVVLTATLQGMIEIGIEIDRYTWREDWFLRLFFGDNYSKYRIITLENNCHCSNCMDTNYVVVTARER